MTSGIEEMHLLGRSGPAVQREVYRSAGLVSSPRALPFFTVLWLIEILLTGYIYIRHHDSPCNVPLDVWVLIFTLRLGISIPLRIYSMYNNPLPKRVTRIFRVSVASWVVVGQLWLLQSSDTCPSGLYIYSLLLLVMVYLALLLPLLVLLSICMCLPCVLIALRMVGDPRRGAPNEMIRSLPMYVYKEEDDNDQSHDELVCAVCMASFIPGEELRTLPCRHDFHLACVDRWLAIKKECPLCRGDIDILV